MNDGKKILLFADQLREITAKVKKQKDDADKNRVDKFVKEIKDKTLIEANKGETQICIFLYNYSKVDARAAMDILSKEGLKCVLKRDDFCDKQFYKSTEFGTSQDYIEVSWK